jgi:hypothetical protein
MISGCGMAPVRAQVKASQTGPKKVKAVGFINRP